MTEIREILSKHAERRRALLMKGATTAPAVSFLLGGSLPAQAATYGGPPVTTAFAGDPSTITVSIPDILTIPTTRHTTTKHTTTKQTTTMATTTTNAPLTFAITPAGTTTNAPLTFAITPAGTTTNAPLTFAITPR